MAKYEYNDNTGIKFNNITVDEKTYKNHRWKTTIFFE